jgi:hypothetical protein
MQILQQQKKQQQQEGKSWQLMLSRGARPDAMGLEGGGHVSGQQEQHWGNVLGSPRHVMQQQQGMGEGLPAEMLLAGRRYSPHFKLLLTPSYCNPYEGSFPGAAAGEHPG